jgi:hypothetical protein
MAEKGTEGTIDGLLGRSDIIHGHATIQFICVGQPTGKPIDQRRDQYEWKALLAEAGVRHDCTTPATSRQPSFCCSASRNGPSWTSWAGPTAQW